MIFLKFLPGWIFFGQFFDIWLLYVGKKSVGDQIFVCYIRVTVISEAVIKGEINIAKAWKNLGQQDLVCYMRVTVISVDVTTGYYCINNTWQKSEAGSKKLTFRAGK